MLALNNNCHISLNPLCVCITTPDTHFMCCISSNSETTWLVQTAGGWWGGWWWSTKQGGANSYLTFFLPLWSCIDYFCLFCIDVCLSQQVMQVIPGQFQLHANGRRGTLPYANLGPSHYRFWRLEASGELQRMGSRVNCTPVWLIALCGCSSLQGCLVAITVQYGSHQ